MAQTKDAAKDYVKLWNVVAPQIVAVLKFVSTHNVKHAVRKIQIVEQALSVTIITTVKTIQTLHVEVTLSVLEMKSA